MPTIVDILREHASEYGARFDSPVPEAHRRAIRDIVSCRTGALGGRVVECGECGTLRFVCHCCRNRACPSCHGQETVEWLADRAGELLPVPYFHAVFTLPASLRDATRRHADVALPLLMRTAAGALRDLARDERFCDGEIGVLAVLHTWTRALLWHPHAHCLVPAVAVGADGSWHRTNHSFLAPVRALSKLFRGRFLRALARALPDEDLEEADRAREWVVFCRPCGEGPRNALAYLARYVFGGPMTGRRILPMRDGRYGLEYTDSATRRRRTVRLEPHELIRRFLQHTPWKDMHRIRYYGFWAHSNLGTLRALRLRLTGGLGEAVEAMVRLARERREGRSRCPVCGAETRVVATWEPIGRTSHFDPLPIRAPPASASPANPVEALA